MWNFMWLDIDSSKQTNDSKWLDIDSSKQTNDSKWLDSFCDTTRPSHDSDSIKF